MPITIEFEAERATKNTIRFQEKVEGEMDTPKIGTLYVQKFAVKQLLDEADTKQTGLRVTLEAIGGK